MMPIEQAAISPMDRGFLFGDGVYEVMARVDGRIRAKSLHKRDFSRVSMQSGCQSQSMTYLLMSTG